MWSSFRKLPDGFKLMLKIFSAGGFTCAFARRVSFQGGRTGTVSRAVCATVGGDFVYATREKLPDRRPAETRDIQADGLRYRATVGRFPDGRLAELFIDVSKVGS